MDMFPKTNNFLFNSQNNCLLFNDINQLENKDYFCSLEVTVNLKKDKTGKEDFYNISYKWDYNDWEKGDQENPGFKYHPFFDNPEFIESHNEGEIIYQNELSDILIKYLLMDLDKMKSLTGNTRPVDYKKTIMESISLLWD